ncbi:Thoeris anti-defense Tad2 family protein [Pontibacillus litoralis]|uniref:Thoeris anti-defense 2-like domain-containing protein n=1 Tax=Pontibacillus litoralis JSM 072002 TaxID=1385512 RepID=A0A0A5G364_9BACI|nr:hypothetical protein [Pontibacillus litoralis]KGX87541.1 hypothetical protein N784_14945 [Pontibacillus litoralis JSM 072002]
MNFIDAATGIEAGKAYKRADWEDNQYIVKDVNNRIRLFNGHRPTFYEASVQDVTANDWVECNKAEWIIFSVWNDHELMNSQSYTTYQLCPKEPQAASCIQIDAEELHVWSSYITLNINADSKYLDEIEINKIQEILQRKSLIS